MLLLACTTMMTDNNHRTPVIKNGEIETKDITPTATNTEPAGRDNEVKPKETAPNVESSAIEVENNPPDIADGGFLSGEPCAPPCFWGIVPGNTTEAEAKQILQTKGLSQGCKAYDNEARSGTRGINCQFIMNISFQLGTDIVYAVGFRPSQKITVEDVITKYGKPDSVSVLPSGIPEDPHTVMLLYYNRMNTRLNLPDQTGITFLVKPSTEVENIAYFDVDRYEKFLRHSFQKWEDYGEYQLNEPY
jgi:hypothetical protein